MGSIKSWQTSCLKNQDAFKSLGQELKKYKKGDGKYDKVQKKIVDLYNSRRQVSCML